MSDRQPNPNDDRLDALLAEARWPEPSDRSRRRAAATWAGVTPHRRRVRWPAAVAACLAIAGGAVAFLLRTDRPQIAQVLVRASLPEQRPAPAFPSRPPRMWEIAALRPAKMRVQPLKPAAVAAAMPATPSDDPYVQALADGKIRTYLDAVADEATRSKALTALHDVARPPTAALLVALSDPHEDVRIAAARALGEIDGPATTAALVRRVRQPAVRREALAALMFSTGEDAARYLRSARSDPVIAAQLQSLQFQYASSE